MAARASGIFIPLPGGGMTSGAPETHSRTTRSPGSTVFTGAKLASKAPQRMVEGVGAI